MNILTFSCQLSSVEKLQRSLQSPSDPSIPQQESQPIYCYYEYRKLCASDLSRSIAVARLPKNKGCWRLELRAAT